MQVSLQFKGNFQSEKWMQNLMVTKAASLRIKGFRQLLSGTFCTTVTRTPALVPLFIACNTYVLAHHCVQCLLHAMIARNKRPVHVGIGLKFLETSTLAGKMRLRRLPYRTLSFRWAFRPIKQSCSRASLCQTKFLQLSQESGLDRSDHSVAITAPRSS